MARWKHSVPLGVVARVHHRLRGWRATVRGEILPVVGSGDVLHEGLVLEEFERQGNEGMDFAPGAVDLSPGDGNVWVVCDPEDPDFGKNMDLRGMSCASGDYGLADRTKGNFSVVKRRPLSTVPYLLSDSIPFLQKLKGSDDVSWKQLHPTSEPLKGLRERLAVAATAGDQVGESAEEDVRTLWVSVWSAMEGVETSLS